MYIVHLLYLHWLCCTFKLLEIFANVRKLLPSKREQIELRTLNILVPKRQFQRVRFKVNFFVVLAQRCFTAY